jgi:hypothetical protein
MGNSRKAAFAQIRSRKGEVVFAEIAKLLRGRDTGDFGRGQEESLQVHENATAASSMIGKVIRQGEGWGSCATRFVELDTSCVGW